MSVVVAAGVVAVVIRVCTVRLPHLLLQLVVVAVVAVVEHQRALVVMVERVVVQQVSPAGRPEDQARRITVVALVPQAQEVRPVQEMVI